MGERPQQRRDQRRRDEVRDVDAVRRVVPPGHVVGAVPQVVLQPDGRDRLAEDRLLEPDLGQLVRVEQQPVGEAAQEVVEEEDRDERRPVADEPRQAAPQIGGRERGHPEPEPDVDHVARGRHARQQHQQCRAREPGRRRTEPHVSCARATVSLTRRFRTPTPYRRTRITRHDCNRERAQTSDRRRAGRDRRVGRGALAVLGRDRRAGRQGRRRRDAPGAGRGRGRARQPAAGATSAPTSSTASAHLLEERREELAATISAEAGKPLKTARVEAQRAASTYTFAAVEARKLTGETVPMDASQAGDGKLAFTLRLPIGIVGAISPVQLPGQPRRAQDRAGARGRLPRRAEARVGDAALGALPREPRGGGRPAARLDQRRRRPGRARSATRSSPTSASS